MVMEGEATSGGKPMFEIEMKAHLDDPARIREKLERIATFTGKARKRDHYYAPLGIALEEIDWVRDVPFRLREVGNRAIVTCKRRRRRAGLEINEEIEFAVDDPAAFDRFAHAIGFFPCITKEKITERFRKDDLTLELNEVKGLGWFLEVEYLSETPSDAERIRIRIRELFATLGIPPEAIEPRYYVEMLREAASPPPGRA